MYCSDHLYCSAHRPLPDPDFLSADVPDPDVPAAESPPTRCLRIDVLTLFPEMFDAALGTSIPKRAAEKGLVEYHLTNIRHFADDAHQSVDDRPFGGGPGMVLRCQTVFDAVAHAEKQDDRPAARILLSPQGRTFNQTLAEELARLPRLLLIAGHYEGFDDRIIEGLCPMEVSLGDYVLSGGELAAMVLIDSVVRLLPGALGAETGAADESFADGLLEYPQYTRPREFRGMAVPEVLLGGNHPAIARWRLEQRRQRTRTRRPDLWQAYLARHPEAAGTLEMRGMPGSVDGSVEGIDAKAGHSRQGSRKRRSSMQRYPADFAFHEPAD